MKKTLFLLVIIFTGLHSQAYNPIKTTKSILPDCSSLNAEYEGGYGVRRMSEVCIGDFLDYGLSDYEKAQKTEEKYLRNGLLFFVKKGLTHIVIERSPLLSISKFLKICRPLGGWMSSDGIECTYEIRF